VLGTFGIIAAVASVSFAQVDKASLKAKLMDEAGERWIYDDLPAGFAAAKASGKPMLVVLRCTK
jgi:hypothetical protein